MAVKYDIFTYQLSPETNAQIKLFDKPTTYKDLVKNKNSYLYDIFTEELNFYSSRHKLNYKIEYLDKGFILIRLANKRTVKIEKSFQKEYFDSEPSCLVAIYNSPDIQLMAVESDRTSFGNSFMAVKIIEKTLERKLKEYHLMLSIQPKFEATVLWDT